MWKRSRYGTYADRSEGGRTLRSLKRLKMASGWGREVGSRLGGVRSCTHPLPALSSTKLTLRHSGQRIEILEQADRDWSNKCRWTSNGGCAVNSYSREHVLQQLLDRAEIEDAIRRYARGVDRGDWEAVRSTYHPDARDEHGEYKGDIDGLIKWLEQRFAGIDNSMHFLGNCLIEFAGPGLALVETYFVSRRLRPPIDGETRLAGPCDAMSREAWGRYLDRFERRQKQWRVAQRIVVLEASSTHLVRRCREGVGTWGRRDGTDRLHQLREEIFGNRRR